MKNYLSFSFLLLFSIGSFSSQAQKRLPGDRPGLIVQIVVGQMRSDYLLRYKTNFTNNGFRVFMDEGTFCQNARFSYMLTQTAPGLATIATGANPAQHGIVSDNWYDRSNDKVVEACYDAERKVLESSNDNLKKSPKHLLANTFSDELKLFHPNTRVFGVAIDPEAAILLSGHAVDAAYWWDETTGKFTTGNYYLEELPEWVKEFNDKKFPELYLYRDWSTIYPQNRYISAVAPAAVGVAPNPEAPFVFMNAVQEKKLPTRNYAQLRQTPHSDNLVKDFAISLVANENLGAGQGVDILTLYFGGCKSIGDKYGTTSMELEDALYRTDENIGHLMSFLHEQIGKENVLIVLTSDHGANLSQKELDNARLPHGTFDANKSLVLLRSYLNIVYGRGNWIKAFHQKQIFLNRTLIEDSNKNLSDVQTKVAEFLIQVSGVSNVMTSNSMDNNNFGTGIMRSMQNGYYPKRSGDVIIHLNPGWIENSSATNSNSPYNYDVHVPLAFYGWRTKRKNIVTPVDMTDIAPTLSTMIGAPLPNTTSGKPIVEIWE